MYRFLLLPLLLGLGAPAIAAPRVIELAPTAEIRQLQKLADAQSGVGKRVRPLLGPEFVSAYRSQILSPEQVKRATIAVSKYLRPAFLCVERHPAACHRSLVSDELARALQVDVEHLHP